MNQIFFNVSFKIWIKKLLSWKNRRNDEFFFFINRDIIINDDKKWFWYLHNANLHGISDRDKDFHPFSMDQQQLQQSQNIQNMLHTFFSSFYFQKLWLDTESYRYYHGKY